MKCFIFIIFIIFVKSLNAEDKFPSEVYEVSSLPCDCEHEYETVIKNKITNITITLKNGTHHVTTVQEYKDKLIVIGEVDSNTKIVNILKKIDLKLIDNFYCFSPKVSQSGRFIVSKVSFQKYSDESKNDIVFMCYDLNKSPIENRLKSYDEKEMQYVGRIIYPEDNYSSKTYLSKSNDSRPPYYLRDEILWPNKSDICIFLVSNTIDVKMVVCNFKDETKNDFRTIDLSAKAKQLLKENEVLDLKQLRIDNLKYDEEKGVINIKTKYIESIKRTITFDIKIEQFDKFK